MGLLCCGSFWNWPTNNSEFHSSIQCVLCMKEEIYYWLLFPTHFVFSILWPPFTLMCRRTWGRTGKGRRMPLWLSEAAEKSNISNYYYHNYGKVFYNNFLRRWATQKQQQKQEKAKRQWDSEQLEADQQKIPAQWLIQKIKGNKTNDTKAHRKRVVGGVDAYV